LSVRIEPIGCRTAVNTAGADVVVFVCDPDRVPCRLEAVLRAIWGLTPSESRLARCLVRGLSLRKAAVHLGTSEGTARFFSK